MLQRSPTSHRGGSIPNFYRIETFVTIATASKDSSSCESGSAIAANSFWRATPPASPKSEVHLFKRQSACTKFRNFLFLLCWNLLTPISASHTHLRQPTPSETGRRSRCPLLNPLYVHIPANYLFHLGYILSPKWHRAQTS